MSRWFRHYAGMMRDEKLVGVAVRSKQPVERVVWVWGAILESAAEINDGGKFDLDAAEAAYFLRCDDAGILAIQDELESAGRIAGGMVAKWGDRQFASDGAAERQRRYRKRKLEGDVSGARCDHNGDVTVTSRDAKVTAPDTETEKIEKEEPNGSSKKRGSRLPDDFEPDMQAARAEGLSEANAQREAAKFRDYWRGVPGQKGVKLDWPATWRNWCRKAADDRRTPARGHSPPRQSLGEFFREDARRQRLIPDDTTDKPTGYLEAGDGSRQDAGSGGARVFAVSGDILGKLG